LSYNLGAALGGAVPPLVGVAITAAAGRNVFGLFLASICLVSALCAFALVETREHDLETVEELRSRR
jgi:hypothetical protein